MHHTAEHGIAAHWRYKEKKPLGAADGKSFAWLHQLMEWQRDLKDPTEFIETVKIDLFEEEVFVFTPKGDVKALPKGATPIDFAYAVHSKIGAHCSGARVNGIIVPLRYPLRNGDTIEILTSTNQKPSKDWLKFVVTSRARTRIRHYLRMEQRERSKRLRPRSAGQGAARAEPLADPAPRRTACWSRPPSGCGRARPTTCWCMVGYGKITPAQAAEAIYPAARRRRAGRGRRRRCRPRETTGLHRRPVQEVGGRGAGAGRGGHRGEVRQVLHPGARRLHHRLHQPRPGGHRPHPRLQEGPGPGPRPPGGGVLGRGGADPAAGGPRGHQHRPARASWPPSPSASPTTGSTSRRPSAGPPRTGAASTPSR